MKDLDFIDYCKMHCQTPVGAFSRRDMYRLGVLAGEIDRSDPSPRGGLIRPSEEWVFDWAKKARNRLVCPICGNKGLVIKEDGWREVCPEPRHRKERS